MTGHTPGRLPAWEDFSKRCPGQASGLSLQVWFRWVSGFFGFYRRVSHLYGRRAKAPLVAIIAILGVIITAAYILLVIRRVFFGELPEEFGEVSGIYLTDKIAIGLLAVVMVALGLFPSLMEPILQSGGIEFWYWWEAHR